MRYSKYQVEIVAFIRC